MTTTEQWFEWLSNPRKARSAMRFLGSLTSTEEVDVGVVEARLRSHDSKQVFWALTALACLAEVGWRPTNVLPTLLEQLRAGGTNALRASALDVLSRSTDGGTLRTALCDGLRDFSDEVRGLAVREIERHRLQSEPEIRAVLEVLAAREPDDYVRGLAESALGSTPGTAASGEESVDGAGEGVPVASRK